MRDQFLKKCQMLFAGHLYIKKTSKICLQFWNFNLRIDVLVMTFMNQLVGGLKMICINEINFIPDWCCLHQGCVKWEWYFSPSLYHNSSVISIAMLATVTTQYCMNIGKLMFRRKTILLLAHMFRPDANNRLCTVIFEDIIWMKNRKNWK